jgi:hypothetical protein
VEHVALEVGQWTLSPQALARFEAQDVKSFSNARAANVRNLLATVVGHDPWPHLAVSGKTVEQTKAAVSAYQAERHQIAHGRTRPQFSEVLLSARMAFFDELVVRMDQYLESVLTATLGQTPW